MAPGPEAPDPPAAAPARPQDLPRSVLVLGSGALKIGEAGEFDYSGSQAIKALKEEGIRAVLVNPNIATVQTSEGLADAVYFLPVTAEFVARVIERERPDGLLAGFGGQTALNCAVALEEAGALDRFGVRVLGTPVAAIRATEDRGLFARILAEIGVPVARSRAAASVDDAVAAAAALGHPVMLRLAYALGGLGSGVCRNEAEVRERAARAFALAPQVLVEEDLSGWKEVEYEIVRDRFDNCVAVCNMENLDPMGIHTGDSIVVAPSQTLTNREYHWLRQVSIQVVRRLGVVGECNIQFALDPASEDYRVIEVNARLSRSSALASKATGYPLAFVAAKLALGYALADVANKVTGVTRACFEPALDYVVVKMPRWDLQKFRGVSQEIGSQMKSVGEVMAIGRSFEEALQKAARMLDIGRDGIVDGRDAVPAEGLRSELGRPTDRRPFAIAQAFRAGWTVPQVQERTGIAPWFLERIRGLVEAAARLQAAGSAGLDAPALRAAKRAGFSDRQVAGLCGLSEDDVRARRWEQGIRPVVKQIDTLAAEYPARTNYLYLTYDGEEDDVEPGSGGVLVLGAGAYRIGTSVEFDWCAVNTLRTLRRIGHATLMLNCNPETVSTDYDECDRLYFEEITFETLCEIHARERALGVILSVGGQAPVNLALRCKRAGIRVLGTDPERVDCAENRHRFSALCDELGIQQPPWVEVASLEAAAAFAARVGYPVLVRPSYVLSGAAMAVAENEAELRAVVERASAASAEHPIVVSKFVTQAKELEIDAVARSGEIVAYALCEHVEHAGVHSGDATMVLPPQKVYLETAQRVRRVAGKVARALQINGPFNMQFMARDNQVLVIECNVRASRSLPFVSKVYRLNLVDLATRIALGLPVARADLSLIDAGHVGVKAPQFSFARLAGADPTLGVDMASTGEVGCLGSDLDDAFLKALLAVGYRLPLRRVLLSTGPLPDKAEFLASARGLADQGVQLYATRGTAAFLRGAGVAATVVCWPDEDGAPNALELIRGGGLDLVVNIPKNDTVGELANDYLIRRAAVDYGVPLVTNVQLARQLADAALRRPVELLEIRDWASYFGDGAP